MSSLAVCRGVGGLIGSAGVGEGGWLSARLPGGWGKLCFRLVVSGLVLRCMHGLRIAVRLARWWCVCVCVLKRTMY